MNMAKNLPHIEPLQKHSTYSVYKRIFNLMLLLIAAAICANLWVLNKEQQQNWYSTQANQLGHSLSRLTAKVLAPMLEQNLQAAIETHLHYLMDDSHVAGVAAYDAHGQRIYQQGDGLGIEQNEVNVEHPLVFVQPIYASENNVDAPMPGAPIGYFRLILNEQSVMQAHSQYQQQVREQLAVLLFMAAVAGGLFARGYYRLRYQALKRRLHKQESAAQQDKIHL